MFHRQRVNFIFHKLIPILLLAGLALAGCSSGVENPLDGTSWILVKIRNADGELSDSLQGTVVNALFQADVVSGLASCNNYSGSYTVNKDQLSFGPLSTTRQMCAGQNVMDQEKTYLAALEKVERFKINESVLEMLDGDGETLLVYGK